MRLHLRRLSAAPIACCPFHALTLGFAGGLRCEAVASDEPPPSFADSTPKQVSAYCRATIGESRDLVAPTDARLSTLIRGVTVIPMTGPTRLPNYDVIIRGDKIVSITPAGAVTPDSNARAIDGAGKFLAPGLSDMHAHPAVIKWIETMVERFPGLGEPERFALPAGLLMLQQLAAGVTRIDVMAGDPDMLFMRDEIKAGRMAGPVMRVGSPIIDGPVPIQSPKMSWLCGDAEGGRKAAQLIAELGYDFAKPYNNLPAAAYEALMEECEARGIPVVGHIPLAVGVDAAVAAGRQDIAHVAELYHWLDGPERFDETRLKRLAGQIKQSGKCVQLTTAVGGRIELVFYKDKTQADFPDTAFCNPLTNKVWDTSTPAMQAVKALPHLKTLARDAERLGYLAARTLHEAGVNLVTGTDAPNSFLADGFSMHEELENLVKHCGFSPFEALKVATVNAAEQHGEGGRAGIVAEGAFADLILLDADPLQDIRATRSLSSVWARGMYLSHGALSEARRRILAAFDAMPVPQ